MATGPLPRVSIRPFAAADRDSILALAPRLTVGIAPWRDPELFLAAASRWIEESITGAGVGSGDDRAVFVAEDAAGACVGFVSVARGTHFTGEEEAYVGELAVAAEVEGRGVGQALMEAAERWARGRGYRLITLETGADNERARRFYGRRGYSAESVKLVKAL